MALSDFISGNMPMTQQPVVQQPGAQQVMGLMDQIVGSRSPYIENARRRGMELAGARGGVNSSIAAGASERSALEAALPLVQQAGEIDRTGANAQWENWLSEQNFGRALFGQKFSSSLGMLNYLQQAAVEDPELYTPEVTSGFSNFFSQNMNNILKSYFNA